ncbi:PilN domain-containing protein [Spirulina subsalsa FACHB-351]|uniref:PilN domain-containing protein n=1 Tax=Spirulina subsalsa FACHB-351 TaxID=234711 RepID=A0ABT3L052_9CYAN|nr:PilN domain-containing protein [Spirulina subsalsa]MCW6034861.1 PilN domain-containing protein [Spirulina subsalsa FACHB-351]
MYSLDINFLKDRAAIPTGGGSGFVQAKTPKRQIAKEELIPLGIGGGIAVLCLGLVGAAYFWIDYETTRTQNTLSGLQADISQLEQIETQIAQLEAQLTVAQEQTRGLAGVFAHIIPPSAILQSVRDVTPSSLKISAIETITPQDTGQEVEGGGRPMPILRISGVADSYDNVNIFLLNLKESPLFNGESARITEAELVDDPHKPEPAEGVTIEVGDALDDIKVVRYSLEIAMQDVSEIPTAELIAYYGNRGAAGSVIRLQALKNKGILEE